MQLRDYQRRAVDDLFAYFDEHTGNPCAILPTAAGKSVILATFIKEACERYPGTRIIVLTHVAKLLKQNAEKLAQVWPGAPFDFYSASIGRKNHRAQVLFAGIQSIWKQAYKVQDCDLILIDECFAAGTMVATPSGPIAIDKVACGDVVYNQFGTGVVEAISIKPASVIYTVELEDGRRIRCTGNHPFFTERGWVKAEELEGHRLYSIEDMSALWQSVPSLDHVQGGWIGEDMYARTSLAQANVLLSKVCEEGCANFAGSSSALENKRASEGEKAQAHQARRQRAVAAFATAGAAPRLGRRMGSGVHGKDACGSLERGVSECVQIGHCEPRTDDRNRIGGRQPSNHRTTGTGPEKGCALGGVRVVSVSSEERGGTEPVFNLQVSGHPSYFADGVAVHNCHLISPKDTTRYRKFLADMKVINPHLKIAGLTASPWRLDSGVIYGQPDSLFTDCCHETTIPELIELGYLCPIQTKHTTRELDVSGVHVRGGEFVASELAQAVDKDEVTRACVDEIVKLDARPGLCFATGVRHAYHIRDEIRSRGYSCEVIDGETPEHERDRHLDALVAGRLDYLSNCAVLTTGVDLPPLRMIADLAPTKSPALHVQKLGRLMRLHPGKDVGIVLDFARNVDEHGPIDLIKPKPKGKGGTGEPVVKTCPKCEEKCATALRQCPACGHEFPPPEVKLQAVASKAPILSTQIEPTWIAVSEVIYTKHNKPGKPASLKVTYRCGMVFHHEWVCFDHIGFARQKAEAWWMKRGQQPIPSSVDTALTRAGELLKPEAISVRPEGKYVRVIGYYFGEQRRVA